MWQGAGVTGRTALRKCYSPAGMLLPRGPDRLPQSQKQLPAMAAPGEPGAEPLGAPSPTNSLAPGHPERGKLVKLEGRQGWSAPGQRRGKGLGQGPGRGSPLLRPGACLQASPGPHVRRARCQRGADKWAPAAGTRCEPAGAPAAHAARVAAAAGQRSSCAARAEDRAPGGESGPCPPRGWPGGGWEGEGQDPEVLSLQPIRSQTFLVRKSNTRQCQALCVRLPEASGPSFVASHYVQQSPGGERDWPGGDGAGSRGRAGRGAGEGVQRTASLPISQASRWRDLSSSSRTWCSSSAPTATPGELPSGAAVGGSPCPSTPTAPGTPP